jgi:hypothetical protein
VEGGDGHRHMLIIIKAFVLRAPFDDIGPVLSFFFPDPEK